MASTTRTLAKYLHATCYEEIPTQTIATTKLAILDNIGSALGACRTNLGDIYTKSVWQNAHAPCSLIGAAGKTSIMEAAFVNASLCQVLDFDDTFEINSVAVSHPGPAVVPAALASAELVGCDGKELIRAVILGYEVAARVARAIEPRKDDFWGFGNTQVMGAATAAATVFGCTVDQLINALGIAAASAPVPNTNMMWGLEKRPMSWVKDAVGIAASTGVTSACLARDGLRGPQDGLDESAGYYLLCGAVKYREEELIADYGKRFAVDLISFKPYPTCRFMQSTLDGIAFLLKENSLENVDIDKVEVHLPPFLAKIFAVHEPNSMIDAQFSLPHALAMVIHRTTPSARWYSGETLTDKEVASTRKKIELIPDYEIESARVEESRLSPLVRIVTKKGTIHQRKEKFALGHPERRLTDIQLQKKFRENAKIVLPGRQLDDLIDAITHLDKASDISKVMELTQAGEGRGV